MKKAKVFEAAVQMSAFQPIDIQPVKGRNWITNGANNSNYKVYKDAYDDSPTNQSIINAYVNYLYADGLYNASELNSCDISQYISEESAELICKDFKMYGGYAVQVIWDSNLIESERKPLLVEHIAIDKLAVNYNQETLEVDGWWYCWNWSNRYMYQPELYPAFTGKYKGNNLEILVVRAACPYPFFPVPNYISGIPWARVEGQLSNQAKGFFENTISGLTILNFDGGAIADDEEREKAAKSIRDQYCGSSGSGRVIVSFNDDMTMGARVDHVTPPDMAMQTTFYSEEAERKLIIAHSAPPIIFSGSNGGNGFSSNADEIAMATKMLYMNNINPMRKVILRGLNKIFNLIDPTIKLCFKDFEPVNKMDQTQ